MMPELDEMLDLAYRQLWQVTVVAGLALAAMRWACRSRPHLAYLLGLVVLAKCWTPPIWSSRGGIFCWPPSIGVTMPNIERGGRRPRDAARDEAELPITVAEEPQHEAVLVTPAQSPAPPFDAPPRASVAAVSLFTAWLLGAIGFLGSRLLRTRPRPRRFG